jgi:hypothetical protein
LTTSYTAVTVQVPVKYTPLGVKIGDPGRKPRLNTTGPFVVSAKSR